MPHTPHTPRRPGAGPRKAWMSWSSGKDSAYALHVIRAGEVPGIGELEVVGLLTTLDEDADRIAMHGVRHELLRRQAAALGLPRIAVELPERCPNGVYEQRMAAAIDEAEAAGVEVMIFGDLFLADIRAYRERMLAGTGISPVFPLWDPTRDTRALAGAMLAAGVVATLSCVDLRKLPIELVGRRWDAALLAELPAGVDPCGENGEFHTFVSDAPGFAEAIPVVTGERVVRGDFAFIDLLGSPRPASTAR